MNKTKEARRLGMVCELKDFQLPDAYYKRDGILALEYYSSASNESFMQGHDCRT